MIKVAMFDTKPYDKIGFEKYAKESNIEIKYFETRLTEDTVDLANGYDAVVVFVNDAINKNLAGISEQEKKYLKQALADLTDGKYLGYGENISRQVLQIEELKTVENAFDKIISIAKNHGFNLSETDEKNFKVCNVFFRRDIVEQQCPSLYRRKRFRAGGTAIQRWEESPICRC
jgi:hypothetical protein